MTNCAGERGSSSMVIRLPVWRAPLCGAFRPSETTVVYPATRCTVHGCVPRYGMLHLFVAGREGGIHKLLCTTQHRRQAYKTGRMQAARLHRCMCQADDTSHVHRSSRPSPSQACASLQKETIIHEALLILAPRRATSKTIFPNLAKSLAMDCHICAKFVLTRRS